MKLLLSLLYIFINLKLYSSLTVKVSEYRDPKCQGLPITINSYSKCSPNKYWRVLENATKIASADVNAIEQCRYTKYTKLKFQQFNNSECKLDENFGYSYKYDLILSDDPKPIKNYCNQLKYFDCTNYSIYSFLNNTCELITSTNFTKQVCIGDKILNYQCKSENCLVDDLESDCKLISSEYSNLNENNNKCKSFSTTNADSKEIQIGLQMFQTNTNNIISNFNILNLNIIFLSISLLLLLL